MTYCVITARGKFVEKAGSDFLFQKKQYFHISEVTVREFDEEFNAQTCLRQHVPFADTNRIAIGIKGSEMAYMLESIKYHVGAEIDAKELGDLEAAIRLGTSYVEPEEQTEFYDVEDELIFVNTKSNYLGKATFFNGRPDIFDEFSDQEKTLFVQADFGGIRVDCGAMLDLYCDKFNDTPGGGYLIAHTMKFDHDLMKFKNELCDLKRTAVGSFNKFMLGLWK